MYDVSMNQTSPWKKIAVFAMSYFLYLLASGTTSSLGDLLGTICLITVASLLCLWMFRQVRTTKAFNIDVPKVPLLTWSFALLFALFLIVIVGLFSNIKGVLHQAPMAMIVSILTAITAGLFEEVLVRLLLMDGLLQLFQKHRYALVYASVTSAGIFGLLHLSNLTVQSASATWQQVFYAMAIGLLFSFIRWRSNGIVLCILFHILIDTQPTINEASPSNSWLTVLLVFGPVMVIGLVYTFLYNRKINKISGI